MDLNILRENIQYSWWVLRIMSNREHRVLSLCGFLGYGFPKSSLDVGLSHFPDVVGVDNGSTDGTIDKLVDLQTSASYNVEIISTVDRLPQMCELLDPAFKAVNKIF